MSTGCSPARCSCKRGGKYCTEGYECSHCVNTGEDDTSIVDNIATDTIAEHYNTDDSMNELDDDTDEIMGWIFGEEIESGDSSSE